MDSSGEKHPLLIDNTIFWLFTRSCETLINNTRYGMYMLYMSHISDYFIDNQINMPIYYIYYIYYVYIYANMYIYIYNIYIYIHIRWGAEDSIRKRS